MLISETDQFFFLAAVGAGVVAAAGANLVLSRSRTRWRAVTTLLVAAVPVTALALWEERSYAVFAAAGMIAACVGLTHAAGLSFVRSVMQKQTVHWAGLATVGFATVVVSGVRYDRALTDLEDATERQSIQDAPTPRLIAIDSPAHTDKGRPVAVKKPSEKVIAIDSGDLDEKKLRDLHLLMDVIRIAPADDGSNCHGWVFAGNRFWIVGSDVESILADNQYEPVTHPACGDIVIYRNATHGVAHSGIIRATSEGVPVLVESKWGLLGIFLHPIDRSPYGTDYVIYRSPRTGHLITGLPSSPLPAPKTDLP